MKKATIILGILLMTVGLYAQESTNPSLLRSSKAVKALNTVPYLQMAFADSAITIAATEDTWHQLTNADSTLWIATSERITEAGDTATISVAGDYVGFLSVDCYATAADTIHIRVVKNDSTALTPKATELSIGTEIMNLSVPYLFESLAVGDDLKVQIQNSNNGDDPIVINGSFVLYLIRYD